eukprot:m.100395 g.100395  ORF g.100395 m.100395 type:complete len:282 (-) comp8928_c0_seq1:875-1720(-)
MNSGKGTEFQSLGTLGLPWGGWLVRQQADEGKERANGHDGEEIAEVLLLGVGKSLLAAPHEDTRKHNGENQANVDADSPPNSARVRRQDAADEDRSSRGSTHDETRTSLGYESSHRKASDAAQKKKQRVKPQHGHGCLGARVLSAERIRPENRRWRPTPSLTLPKLAPSSMHKCPAPSVQCKHPRHATKHSRATAFRAYTCARSILAVCAATFFCCGRVSDTIRPSATLPHSATLARNCHARLARLATTMPVSLQCRLHQCHWVSVVDGALAAESTVRDRK